MFVDTNIFVFARNLQAPASAVARSALVKARDEDEPVRISRQVMREYLSVMTRPQTWSRPLSMTEALNDFAWMETTFEILEDSRQVMDMFHGHAMQGCSGGRKTDPRRKYRRYNVGPWRAAATEFQHFRLPPLRKSHRTSRNFSDILGNLTFEFIMPVHQCPHSFREFAISKS